jgi:formylglycine-generating enzyme required for sulfatase activity
MYKSPPVYFVFGSGGSYRLPTEMEWMWAAMGDRKASGYTNPTHLTGYGKFFLEAIQS